MAQVSLSNVAKIYDGNVKAVKNIDLKILDREFMVLVGPSGCGKSTTLRMIAGLEEISEGIVKIGERAVNDVPPKDRDIAMVFQNYALYPHMSVFENMAFGLKLQRLPKAEIAARVRNAADILGLHEYLDRRPKQLSGGQRQRVAVGRAIVRQPSVFLFDEPLSNLDAKMRVQMRTEISKLHSQLDTTMIYVTHDQIEAMTMGDRICVMKDGVIQQVDTPLAIYDTPANLFVASFIGTPPMNFFKGQIIEADEKLMFLADVFELPLTNPSWREKLSAYIEKPVVFGIRPEDIDSESVERNPSGLTTIKAVVEVLEPMGSETYVYLRSGKESFIAKVDAHKNIKVGEELVLPLNLNKAHFFDATTENLIV